MWKRALVPLSLMLGMVAGCPFAPTVPSVLQGTWDAAVANDAEHGYTMTFDSSGRVTRITRTNEANQTVTVTPDSNATSSTVSGSNVTITFQGDGGGAVTMTGTLSEDGNTITGSLSAQLDLGNATISIPGGAITLTRQEN